MRKIYRDKDILRIGNCKIVSAFAKFVCKTAAIHSRPANAAK